jgi:ABC-type polysaccharide/polyol phosphate transport system ATPase subunit
VDAITVRDITKTYRIGVGRARVREMLPWPLDRAAARLFPRWWTRDTFNALEDVSVTIPQASSVGIVGHNGAGKTTLLKVIAGVTAPSGGWVRTEGRIGALIDLLVGFHPDLTGEENTYLLGAMHGVGRKAMRARIPTVLDFADIHDLAGTPVKRYSAGMQARLGFAVLVAIEPEILLVDEVLAVGDAAFQRKCFQWLDGYRSRGGTLVFVSHNLSLVRSMTERALWLDHGRLAGEGRTADVLAEYARTMERRPDELGAQRHRRLGRLVRTQAAVRFGAGGARVREVHVEEPEDGEGQLEFFIRYEASSLDRAVFAVGFVDEAGQEIGAATSPPLALGETEGVVRCAIRPAPFRSGIYFPVAAILSPDGTIQDRWRLDRAVIVDRNGEAALAEEFGPVDIPATWSEG